MDQETTAHLMLLADLVTWTFTTEAENVLDFEAIQALREECRNQMNTILATLT